MMRIQGGRTEKRRTPLNMLPPRAATNRLSPLRRPWITGYCPHFCVSDIRTPRYLFAPPRARARRQQTRRRRSEPRGRVQQGLRFRDPCCRRSVHPVHYPRGLAVLKCHENTLCTNPICLTMCRAFCIPVSLISLSDGNGKGSQSHDPPDAVIQLCDQPVATPASLS